MEKREGKYTKVALQNIKIIIDTRGIKKGELERAVGLSQGYLSRLNDGIYFETMVSICKYLGVSIDDIIKDDLLREIQGHQDAISDCMTRINERFKQEV